MSERTPVAPTPVANPIREAQKKEKSLATQLMRYDLSPEQKQDMAFNAGKKVGDFFATRGTSTDDGIRYRPGDTAETDTAEDVEAEMEAIKEKAINDGTFMKAPNGKPTNLTERQWLQVRTKNFIKWFGDWIAAYRASQIKNLNPEKLVPMPKDKTSLEVYESLRNGVNKQDGIEVKFFKSPYKKVIKVGQISEQIIASLPNIFDNSILAYSGQDNLGGLTL